MPVKSRKQAGKFGAMYSRGEISKATLEHWTKGVKVSKLPLRVKRKSARKRRK